MFSRLLLDDEVMNLVRYSLLLVDQLLLENQLSVHAWFCTLLQMGILQISALKPKVHQAKEPALACNSNNSNKIRSMAKVNSCEKSGTLKRNRQLNRANTGNEHLAP